MRFLPIIALRSLARIISASRCPVTEARTHRLWLAAFILLCLAGTIYRTWELRHWETRSRAIDPFSEANTLREVDGFRARGFGLTQASVTLFGPRYPNDGRNQRRRRTLAYRDAEQRVHYPPDPNICSILPKRCSDRNRYRTSSAACAQQAPAAILRAGSVSDADLVSWRLLSSCLPASQWFRSPTPTPAFICSATRLRCCWWRSASQSASTACGGSR